MRHVIIIGEYLQSYCMYQSKLSSAMSAGPCLVSFRTVYKLPSYSCQPYLIGEPYYILRSPFGTEARIHNYSKSFKVSSDHDAGNVVVLVVPSTYPPMETGCVWHVLRLFRGEANCCTDGQAW